MCKGVIFHFFETNFFDVFFQQKRGYLKKEKKKKEKRKKKKEKRKKKNKKKKGKRNLSFIYYLCSLLPLPFFLYPMKKSNV